jgi:outer membrane protein OmpA-like peptidoglycan-associated protein
VREVKEGVTKGLSIGYGGAASRITEPGSDNNAVGVATGGVIGTNRVRAEEWPEFEILCLNDGLIEAPQMPGPPPESRPAQAPPPQVLPPPPEQKVTVRVEVVQIPPPSLPSPLAPAPPSPPPPTQVKEAGCELPPFTVYFDFDRYQVKAEYRSKIGEIVAWMADHKTCQVQVEGHTCRIGSVAYNANLGRNRANAVYNALLAAGASKEQVKQFPSLGKDRPASENYPENRRVILRVIGPASGK